MKVKQLQLKLKEFNPELDIVAFGFDGNGHKKDITVMQIEEFYAEYGTHYPAVMIRGENK